MTTKEKKKPTNPWELNWDDPEKTLQELNVNPGAPSEQPEPAPPIEAVPAEPGFFEQFNSLTDNPISNYFKENRDIQADMSNAIGMNRIRKDMLGLSDHELAASKYAQTPIGQYEKERNKMLNNIARNVENPIATAAGGELVRMGQQIKKHLKHPTNKDFKKEVQRDIDFGGEMLARLRNEKPFESLLGSTGLYMLLPELRLARGMNHIPGFKNMKMNYTSKNPIFNIAKRNEAAARMRKFANSPIKNKDLVTANLAEKGIKKAADWRAELIDAGTRVGVNLPKRLSESKLIDNTLLAGSLGAIHPDDDMQTAMLAAGLGYQGGKLIAGKLGNPRFDISEQAKQNNAWLKKNELFTPISLKTGTRFNEMMDSGFEDNARTANIMAEKFTENNKKISNIAARAIGDPDIVSAEPYMRTNNIVSDWSEGYIDSQYNRLGMDLDIVEDRMAARFSKNDLYKVNQVLKGFEKNVNAKGNPTLNAQSEKILRSINKALKSNDGFTQPKEYVEITKELRDLIRSSSRRKPEVAKRLEQLERIVHKAGEKGSSPSDIKLNKVAREQYARLKLIEGAVNADGYIDPNKLYSRMNNRFWGKYLKRGSADPEMQDLVEIARYGKRLKSRKGASLGASQEIAHSIAKLNPAEAAFHGASWLASTADLGIGPKLLLGLYNLGYPHSTGYVPFMSKDFMSRIGSRATFGTGQETEDKKYKD